MKLKICGMTRQADLDFADRLGFDFCGFIFHKGSPRYLEPQAAASLNSGQMKRVGVFVRQSVAEILAIMDMAGLAYAQLHGDYSPADVKAIGPGRVIKVIWPERHKSGAEIEAEAARYACAWYLLDAGLANGGSGKELNWSGLAGLNLPAPWFLAGGLKPENAGAAILSCSPYGLDFNSGLEQKPGIKDHAKMRAAIYAADKGI